MLEKIKKLGNLPLVIILVIVVIIAIVLSIFKAQKSEESNTDTYVSDAANQDEIEGEKEQDPFVEEIIDEEVPENEEEEPEENLDSKYFIRVNYGQNVVTIYTKDSNGEYTVPYKAMVCSTGTATPTSGTYTMPSSGSKSPRGVWGMMIGNVWAQYYTRIKGSILFHSVPYTERNKWSLEYWEYDKLGTAASAGCVRLTVEDAKWIYNNCPAGTKVEFYTDSNPGPLGKPAAQKISEEEAVRGWDPTDPDTTNPWKTYTPEEEEEPDTEDNNTNTNAKPSTTTKPAKPAKPSTPSVSDKTPETPDEGNVSGDETTTPSEGENSGTETTPPDEGGSSGENQEGSGSTGEETTNPDGEGSTGEEPTNPDEEEPNEGDNSSEDNTGGEQAGSGENDETPPQEYTTTDDNSNKNA